VKLLKEKKRRKKKNQETRRIKRAKIATKIVSIIS
jgi:hypothetical protein